MLEEKPAKSQKPKVTDCKSGLPPCGEFDPSLSLSSASTSLFFVPRGAGGCCWKALGNSGVVQCSWR